MLSALWCFSPREPRLPAVTPSPEDAAEAHATDGTAAVDAFVKVPVASARMDATPPDAGLAALDKAAEAQGIRRVGDNLFCGPRPTDAMIDRLKSLGVKTIVNLEDYHTYWGLWGWRTQATAERAGLNVVRQPISVLFKVSRQRVQAIVDIISNPARGPFYVHCLVGRERTNLVVALHRRINQGMPKDAVRQAMLDDGFRPMLVMALASQVDALLIEAEAIGRTAREHNAAEHDPSSQQTQPAPKAARHLDAAQAPPSPPSPPPQAIAE